MKVGNITVDVTTTFSKAILTLVKERIEQEMKGLHNYFEEEDFNPIDYSGGNFDDCFSMGITQGEFDAYSNALGIINDVIESFTDKLIDCLEFIVTCFVEGSSDFINFYFPFFDCCCWG